MGVVLILPKVALGDGSCPFAGGRAHCLSRQGRCPEGGDAPTVGAAFAFPGTPGELPRRGERPNDLVRTVVAHRGMSAGLPCRPALRRRRLPWPNPERRFVTKSLILPLKHRISAILENQSLDIFRFGNFRVAPCAIFLIYESIRVAQ